MMRLIIDGDIWDCTMNHKECNTFACRMYNLMQQGNCKRNY